MMLRVCLSALFLLSLVCTHEQVTPLFLRIILPIDNDTLHSPTFPVEGETTVGAAVFIGATDNPTTPVTVDSDGHFAGSITVTAEEGQYSVFIKTKMDTRQILESRSVYYMP